ncbi:MAG: zinc ribbon domain-containing protein [Comamonadaceae bacterium]|nr:MAG: zinc ribbon domain-containing protein [Comamonadaceae bacterium]
MHSRCPKCGHAPLPADQSLPAACPACGVILAKLGQIPVRHAREDEAQDPVSGLAEERGRWTSLLLHVPERVDSTAFWLRVVLLAAFALWGGVLIAQDVRTGELGSSFLHRPLLIFHEAGHVVFAFLGHWMMIAGGTLGQLLMPLVLAGALLLKNRDPFGAAIGLWFLGVSLLDVAPYMYDALQPQLMLLSGTTGEEGGHDWIFLFSSLGWLAKSQFIGLLTHKLGALVVIMSTGWAAWVLRLQHTNLSGVVLNEE